MHVCVFCEPVWAYLCHAAEAGVGFRGSDLQNVEVVPALVVDSPGEAERPALLVDAEQIPRIHQQHVGQTLLLEGDGLNRCNTAQGWLQLESAAKPTSAFFRHFILLHKTKQAVAL